MSMDLDPVKAFPKGVPTLIFSYLNKSELAVCCRVSKAWREVASADILWTEVAIQKLGKVPKVPNIKEFLDDYGSERPRSNEENYALLILVGPERFLEGLVFQ